MGIPVATITSARQKLPETVELLSLEVRRELNRVPEAILTLLDGSVALRKFEVSDTDFFAPGKLITVAMRYEGDKLNTVLFEGLVVRHAIESRGEGSTLRVELKDSAFKLTRARKTAVHRDGTDADAMRAIIGAYPGLKAKVDTTSPEHPELVQFNATDWDFVLSRADVCGLVVNVHLGEVTVTKLALGAVKRKLDHGLGDVSDIALEIDSAEQWAAVKSVGWDAPAVAATAPEVAAQPSVKVGDLDAADIAKLLGGDESTMFHAAPFQPGELKAWASARLLRSRHAMLRGKATVSGDGKLAPLDTVEILGVGKKFNGKTLVSGVTHKVDNNGWQTELQLGLSPDWFAREPDIEDVPAGGLLPPVRGLQIGTVASLELDPKKELRVQVKLPLLADDQGFLWARLASPDAGNQRGFSFRPEVGDEVVIGFLNEDPRQPIILGALFGTKNLPPKPVETPTDTNDLRAIVSRAGTRIVFDDSLPSLTLETTADGSADGAYKNRIVVNQKDKKISIEDEHGNVLLMDSAGMTLTSAKDFTIDAGSGNVVIKGSKVDIQ